MIVPRASTFARPLFDVRAARDRGRLFHAGCQAAGGAIAAPAIRPHDGGRDRGGAHRRAARLPSPRSYRRDIHRQPLKLQ